MVKPSLFQDIEERKIFSMGYKDECLHEDEATEYLAVVLDSLVEYVAELVVLNSVGLFGRHTRL